MLRALVFCDAEARSWSTNVFRTIHTENRPDFACVSDRVVDRVYDVGVCTNHLIGCIFARRIRTCTFRLTSYLGEAVFLAFFLLGDLSRSGRSARQSNRGNSRRSDR